MADFRIKIKKIYSDLNSVDINKLIKRLNSIKLEDLRKLNINDIKSIHKTKSFPVLLGGIGFIILSYFLSYPSLINLINLRKKADLYESHSFQLPELVSDLDQLKQKLKKIETPFLNLKESVLNKNQLILINRILSEVASKSDVQILSLIKIKDNPFAICRALNEDEQSNIGITYDNTSIPDSLIQDDLTYTENFPDDQLDNSEQSNFLPEENPPPEIINFKNNYLEISLQAKYFNTIQFIRLLQRYEITIIPVCINIGASPYQQNSEEERTNGEMNSKFIINIPTEEE